MKLRLLKISSLVLVAAFLVGCTSDQILITLKASVAATEVLVASLEATGKIPPGTANMIITAIQGLPDAYQLTSAELASTDPAALKAAKIAGYFSTTLTALNALPPEAQLWARAVTDAINAFLGKLTPPPGLQAARTSPAMATGALAPINDRVFSLTERISKLEQKRLAR